MNKILLFTVSAALMAAAFSSCEPQDNPDPDKKKAVDFGNFKFTSTFSARDTKTKWTTADRVAIYWNDKSAVVQPDSAKAVSTFHAAVDSADRYWAVYPASDSVVFNPSDSTFSVTVCRAQGGYLARTGVSIAKATVANPEFKFRSVIPTLKFTVDRDDVTSVSLRAYNGEALTGTVLVKQVDSTFIFGTACDKGDEIEVAVDGQGTYYVTVLPEVAYSKGILMRYSKSGEYLPATLVESVAPDGRTVYDLGTVGSDADFYVNDAASAAKMREMMHTPSYKSETKTIYNDTTVISLGWLVNGMTFHIGAATLDLNEGGENGAVVDCEYWYYGDRYKTPVRISITGQSREASILTGSVDADKTTGHGIFKIQDYTKVTFKNITFKDTFRPGTSKGGAVQISSKTECGADIDSCAFDNCNVLEDGGGAIGMVDGGVLRVANTTFTNCTARYGGAFYGTAVSNSEFENCTFSGNKGMGQNGPSVAVFWKHAVVRFNHCVFKSNSAVNRAVLNARDTSVLFLNSCAFVGNSNTAEKNYASAIHVSNDFTAINNCTFYQNNTKSDDKPLDNSECISGNGNMLITNSTFYEYYQANRGVVTGLAAGKKAVIFNDIVLNSYSQCVFYFSSAGYSIQSAGHNVYQNVTDYRKDNAKVGIPAATGDVAGAAKTVLNNATWDSANNLYKWDGTLVGHTLVKATASDFETAVKSFDTALSNEQLKDVKAGNAFWSWLSEKNETNKDQTGATRSASWWPGSYQFN